MTFEPPPTATAGNRVHPHVGEIAFFTRLLESFADARRRVWMTLSFISPAFRFPTGQTLWDVLTALADRGVEVRLLCWHNPTFFSRRNLFQGDNVPPLDPRWAVRWQTSPDSAHCHHEKLWIVDPGDPDGHAFVGGIVHTRTDLVERARSGRPEGRHDLAIEVQGPAATEVAHAFAGRWHAAQDDARRPHGPWVSDPSWHRPADVGDAHVQVARTRRAGVDAVQPTPATEILEGYLDAIHAAESTLYLENQHPGEERILAALGLALRRGVQVMLVVPGEPMQPIRDARRSGAIRYAETFHRLNALGEHPGFTLAALAQGEPREEVYVHAKLMIADGRWITCGSANLVDLSLCADHTELNLGIWHPPTAAALQAQLIALHGLPGDSLQDLAARARANAARHGDSQPLEGRIYALDPHLYGLDPPS